VCGEDETEGKAGELVIGYTSERWRASLQSFVEGQRWQLAEQVEDGDIEQADAETLSALLDSTTLEEWAEQFDELAGDGWGGAREDLTLRRFLFDEDSFILTSPFEDDFERLRSVIDLHASDDLVRFSFNWAVVDQDVDPSTRFTELARSTLTAPARALEKILILTEGPSDTELLAASLLKMYPEIEHMYSFS
jgi:hypothetical protein